MNKTTQQENGDIRMTQTDRGVVIQSSDTILFDTGKADIKPTAAPFLDGVANILKTKSSSHVVIEGHTDNVGSVRLNQELSELRALTVMKALIDRGVAKERIKASGYGMSRPIASNNTLEGRQRNRRTDIILLGERQENLQKQQPDDFWTSLRKTFSPRTVTKE